jgi:hypothetical protein
MPERRRRCTELFRCKLIESEVELQNVDAWLAEHPKSASSGVLLDEVCDDWFRHITRLSDAGNLELGGGRGDVRVETAPRGRDEVNRDGFVVLGLELLDIALDAVNKRLAGRPKVWSRWILRIIGRGYGLGGVVRVSISGRG